MHAESTMTEGAAPGRATGSVEAGSGLAELSVLRVAHRSPDGNYVAYQQAASANTAMMGPVRYHEQLAPAWAVLAIERESDGSLALQKVRTVLARRWFTSVAGCIAGVGAIAFTGGLITGLAVTVAAAVVLLTGWHLPAVQQWRSARERQQLHRRAILRRAELRASLPRDQQIELDRLETLVDSVRIHGWRTATNRNARGAGSVWPLAARLDALLLQFVDLAIELRRVRAAFAVTQDDMPRLPDAFAVDPPNHPGGESEKDRCRKIVRLRVRAREGCLTRMARLDRELASISQIVRLVHEQTLSAPLFHHELSGELSEILDEAENERQAREELDAVIERARRESDLTP